MSTLKIENTLFLSFCTTDTLRFSFV